jgi:hypothetical protein
VRLVVMSFLSLDGAHQGQERQAKTVLTGLMMSRFIGTANATSPEIG